ncbi:MAG: type II toxin-antitoxin system VapC family toxin [Actinomycetota bacterium]|nr:type II toxin-antitoxin system VapC family toxin [Actinomycetota bacterium]
MVLDASLALAYVMPDEDSSAASTLLVRIEEGPVLAPTIWIYEIASALRMGQVRSRLTSEMAESVLTTLAELHVEFENPNGHQLMRLSHQTGLTVYDASYIALCLKHQLPLASLDRRLVRAARDLGIVVLT